MKLTVQSASMPSYEIPTLSESTQFFNEACQCVVKYHELPSIHEANLAVLACLHLGETEVRYSFAELVGRKGQTSLPAYQASFKRALETLGIDEDRFVQHGYHMYIPGAKKMFRLRTQDDWTQALIYVC
jgi:hypothetical protein